MLFKRVTPPLVIAAAVANIIIFVIAFMSVVAGAGRVAVTLRASKFDQWLYISTVCGL